MTSRSISQEMALIKLVDGLPNSALSIKGSKDFFAQSQNVLVLGDGPVSCKGLQAIRKRLKAKCFVIRFNDYGRRGALRSLKSDMLCLNSETSERTVSTALADGAIIFPLDRYKRGFNKNFCGSPPQCHCNNVKS